MLNMTREWFELVSPTDTSHLFSISLTVLPFSYLISLTQKPPTFLSQTLFFRSRGELLPR